MRWLAQLRMRIQMLFGRGRAAARLDDELQFHLERQIAENLAAGMNADEARYAALRSFGNPALLRDQARATWSWTSLELLLRDVRYGARTLKRTPGFAAIAILVIALGIGANVALFTIVRSVLLKPLPFKEPDRLFMLYEHKAGSDLSYNVVAGGIYAEWKKQNRTFSNLALLQDSQVGLSGSGGQLPENLSSAECSWNLFSTLGVRTALGRDFTAADDSRSANGTVVLSWGLWKRRFGSDPGILNRNIFLDAKPYTVIGVMPEWFAFPETDTQLWTPVYHDKPERQITMIDGHMFRVVGRLNPGVTEAQGVADLSMISRRIHDAHLDNPFIFMEASSRPLLEHMVGQIKRPLYVLLAATGCVLLIACLNVANLLVARAAARRKELAIRTALGGSRLRQLRQHLMESLLLSAAGGALGLALAYAALGWVTHARQDMSRVESVHMDGAVAAFTVAVVVLCALLSGMISAVSASDKRILSSLHESSRSLSAGNARATLRRVLLSLEVGLTVVLLIGAGLLLKSYQRLRSSDMGCITENVLTMRLGLPAARYKTPAMRANFFETLLTRVREMPGVDAAGFVEAVPGQGYWEDSGFTILEHPPLPQGTGLYALNRTADPKYFAAMGIPILRGHTFDDNQRLDQANQIVISQTFAEQYFPGEEPLGKHLHTNGKDYVITGIVGDTRYEIGEPVKAMKYFPLYSGEDNDGTLVLRTNHNSGRGVEQLALPVQRIVQQLDRDLPVSKVLTMDQLLGRSTLDESFNTTLLSAFAVLSLLLAAVGLFGVLSYIVAQRTSEIGIRLALGAQREQVLRLVLVDGLRPALFGLGFGLVASVGAARLMRSMLYGTQPLDPVVFTAVAAMLLLVAAAACMVPAWRASRLDPMQALRTE
jgi:putative ABC transport system permease protein